MRFLSIGPCQGVILIGVTSAALSSPRERIIQAALALIEEGGAEAVSTRSVSARADVQAPTIYRQFGDMEGLLKEVAIAGFTAYLQTKTPPERDGDPVEALRTGWNMHIEFGLTHPHLYRLMYGAVRSDDNSSASQEAFTHLRALMQRIAERGRLKVGVERAATMFHAAALGVTLSLISVHTRDKDFSERMREAVLTSILTSGSDNEKYSAQPQTVAHAVALIALLPQMETPFSDAERTLLLEWLQRLQ